MEQRTSAKACRLRGADGGHRGIVKGKIQVRVRVQSFEAAVAALQAAGTSFVERRAPPMHAVEVMIEVFCSKLLFAVAKGTERLEILTLPVPDAPPLATHPRVALTFPSSAGSYIFSWRMNSIPEIVLLFFSFFYRVTFFFFTFFIFYFYLFTIFDTFFFTTFFSFLFFYLFTFVLFFCWESNSSLTQSAS